MSYSYIVNFLVFRSTLLKTCINSVIKCHIALANKFRVQLLSCLLQLIGSKSIYNLGNHFVITTKNATYIIMPFGQ